MFAQRDAVIRLLGDEDEETIRLVKEQLRHQAVEHPADFVEFAQQVDGVARRHIQDILDQLQRQEAEGDFDLYCRFFDDAADVEPALWVLAHALRPGLDLAPYREKISQWGRRLAIRLAGAVSNRERVLVLGDFMAGELCFRGNTGAYYHERNSLVPCVMDTRMGIPLSLTLLYRMVALRAGMLVDGINLPGHFIARHEGVLFDPFHKGRILTRKDCEFILLRQNLRLKNCHLLPATPRQILTRTLLNLLHVYIISGNCAQTGLIESWLTALGGVLARG